MQIKLWIVVTSARQQNNVTTAVKVFPVFSTEYFVRYLGAMVILCTMGLLEPSSGQGQGKSSASRSQCTNGCGPSGWLGSAVPDWIGKCQLKAACDNHDICYSRCTKDCGDLFGKTECDGDCGARRVRKRGCDAALEKEIVAFNPGSDCATYARAYRLAVSHFGCAFFRGFGPENEMTRKERFERNFTEALKAVQYEKEHPGTIDISGNRETLEKLASIEAGRENDLAFKVDEGNPRLALRAVHVSPSLAIAPASKRHLVNGIDVTEMVVDGELFNLKEMVAKKKDFDAQGLHQTTVTNEGEPGSQK